MQFHVRKTFRFDLSRRNSYNGEILTWMVIHPDNSVRRNTLKKVKKCASQRESTFRVSSLSTHSSARSDECVQFHLKARLRDLFANGISHIVEGFFEDSLESDWLVRIRWVKRTWSNWLSACERGRSKTSFIFLFEGLSLSAPFFVIIMQQFGSSNPFLMRWQLIEGASNNRSPCDCRQKVITCREMGCKDISQRFSLCAFTGATTKKRKALDTPPIALGSQGSLSQRWRKEGGKFSQELL